MALTTEAKQAIDLAAGLAAEMAVKKILLSLGVDASTPPGVQEHQQDWAFLRKMRLTIEGRKAKIVLLIIATCFSLTSGVALFIVERLIFQ
jgi:hypothetical protein